MIGLTLMPLMPRLITAITPASLRRRWLPPAATPALHAAATYAIVVFTSYDAAIADATLIYHYAYAIIYAITRH